MLPLCLFQPNLSAIRDNPTLTIVTLLRSKYLRLVAAHHTALSTSLLPSSLLERKQLLHV